MARVFSAPALAGRSGLAGLSGLAGVAGRTAVVLAAVGLLLSSCTSDDAAPVTAPSTPATPASELGAAPCTGSTEADSDCGCVAAHGVVTEFVEAFNAGETPALQELWAQSGQGFQWYSTTAPGQRLGANARDRASLSSYFAARNSVGEALQLASFRFTGTADGYGNFEFTVIRQSDDLAPTTYTGKGAVVCAATPPKLGVWSMGAA